jgi:tetratricopeptide (TPR) repeat protein
MAVIRPPAWPFCTKAVLSLLLVVTTCVSYWPLWQNEFVNYDDDMYVQFNPYVKAGLTGPSVWWAITEVGYTGNWHPLTWISLQLDQTLFGSRPVGFHFTNLLFHLANSVVLLHVLERMTAALWQSALVAGLFALHPLHVESVAWIAERKDVLSTLFWLLTMAAYRRYAAGPTTLGYLFVVLIFALGLMAKPMLVTLPCVLLLLDYWPLHRLRPRWLPVPAAAAPYGSIVVVPASLARLVAEKTPFLLLAAGSSFMTVLAQQRAAAVNPLPFTERLSNALVATVSYLGQTFWPTGLAVLYPHPSESLGWAQAGAAGALLILITGWALWRMRTQPYLLVGWLWFLGTLVPVSGLVVQVGSQARADRYTYIPLIGLFMGLVWGLGDLVDKLRVPQIVVSGAAGAMLTACAVASACQLGVWKDSLTLWEHTLAVTQDNHLAHNKLGMALLDMKRLKMARFHFERALEIHPSPLAEYNLARVLLEEGDRVGAIRHFEKTLQIQSSAVAEYNVARLLLEAGDRVGAIRHFQRCLDEVPDNPAGHYRIAQVYDTLEMLQAAASHYSAALQSKSDYGDSLDRLNRVRLRQGKAQEAIPGLAAALPNVRNPAEVYDAMGWVWVLDGETEQAQSAFQKAAEIDPSGTKYGCDLAQILSDSNQKEASMERYRLAVPRDPGWLPALNLSAWSLATQPDPGFRDSARAMRLARQLCEATAYQAADYLDTLAAAYAAAGRFSEAAALVRQALIRGQPTAEPAWVAAVEARRQLYHVHQAFYEDPVAAAGFRKSSGDMRCDEKD